MASSVIIDEQHQCHVIHALLHKTNEALESAPDQSTNKKTAETALRILRNEIGQVSKETLNAPLYELAGKIESIINVLPDDSETTSDDDALFDFLTNIALTSYADFGENPPDKLLLANSINSIYCTLLSSWSERLEDRDRQKELTTQTRQILTALEKTVQEKTSLEILESRKRSVPVKRKCFVLVKLLERMAESLLGPASERNIRKKTADVGLRILRDEMDQLNVEQLDTDFYEVADALQSLINVLPDDAETIPDDEALFDFLSNIVVPSYADFGGNPPTKRSRAKSIDSFYVTLLSSWSKPIEDCDRQKELATRCFQIFTEFEKIFQEKGTI